MDRGEQMRGVSSTDGNVIAFWCPSCGYQHPERFEVLAAAKNECPKCQSPLRWVRGDKHAVEEFLRNIRENPSDCAPVAVNTDYWDVTILRSAGAVDGYREP